MLQQPRVWKDLATIANSEEVLVTRGCNLSLCNPVPLYIRKMGYVAGGHTIVFMAKFRSIRGILQFIAVFLKQLPV